MLNSPLTLKVEAEDLLKPEKRKREKEKSNFTLTDGAILSIEHSFELELLNKSTYLQKKFERSFENLRQYSQLRLR